MCDSKYNNTIAFDPISDEIRELVEDVPTGSAMDDLKSLSVLG
jgi:hypothetical protein